MSSKVKTNCAHSFIDDFPINFSRFPLAEKVPFQVYDLGPNESLYIPSGWFHWVFTEPETLSVSCKYLDPSLPTEPFVQRFPTIHVDYQTFMKEHGERPIQAVYNTNYDMSPVHKSEEDDKVLRMPSLKLAYEHSKAGPYYIYMFFELPNCPTDLDPVYEAWNHFSPTKFWMLWSSFTKPIHSGIHSDETAGNLLVLTGKKRVFLAPPSSKPDLYITTFPELV